MATIAPWLSVLDATAAVAFYRSAFGADTIQVMESEPGVVEVAELDLDGATLWVQRDQDLPAGLEPGMAVRLIVEVEDPDAAFATAIAAGATQRAGIHEDHGWRTGRVADPFGHQWELARRSHS